jgi:hypothetical protein
MEMKLVKEHINEKFIKDSDPIRDLGIGTEQIIEIFQKEIEKHFPLLRRGPGYVQPLITYSISTGKIKIITWPFSDVGIVGVTKALEKIEEKYKSLFKVIQWPVYRGVYYESKTKRNKSAIIKIL